MVATQQTKRARVTALILGLVAVGFYTAFFIIMVAR